KGAYLSNVPVPMAYRWGGSIREHKTGCALPRGCSDARVVLTTNNGFINVGVAHMKRYLWSMSLIGLALLACAQSLYAADWPCGDVACLINAIKEANGNGEANT